MLLDADDENTGPTHAEHLAAELRLLRNISGLSGRELARRLGVSQSKISRIESGHTLPSMREVLAWAEAVSASAQRRQWLVQCTEAAFTEVSPWHTALSGRVHLQDAVRHAETAAVRLRVYQPSVVPGLLQTEQYARQVFSLFREIPYGETELTAAVEGRKSRQLALYEEDRRFDFLITEAALRWRPGPLPLLHAQLDRLVSLSLLQNVNIGVIPQDIPALTYTSHAFTIRNPVEKPSYVSIETIHAELTVRDPEEVLLYEKRWELLSRMAAFGAEARVFLERIRASLQNGGPVE